MKKINKIIPILVSILLISILFFDMLRNTSIKDIEIFNFSIIEISNLLLITSIFFLTLIKISKKQLIKYIPYVVLVILYLFFHIQNIWKFNTNILDNTNINTITELYYLIRTYIMPLLLLFSLIKNKDILTKDYYLKLIKLIIIIMSFSIIVLNVLKLSFISYSGDNTFISHNIFDYLFYRNDYKLYTSRGWFNSANEISAILFALLPINIYLFYNDQTKSNIIILLGQILAMIMVGTRIAAVGTLLVVAFALISYAFIIIIKKLKRDKSFIKRMTIILFINAGMLAISPFALNEYKTRKETIPDNDEAYIELKAASNDTIASIIRKYSYDFRINDAFFELYPVEKDIEFWTKIALRDKYLNNNSRTMKKDIIKRVKELNNNKNDTIFGMGYTINFMDIERDYIYQYYLFGIGGLIILIGPYLIILVLSTIKFFNKMNYFKILSLTSVGLILISAYLSGHVFGWILPMIYLVLLTSFMNQEIGSD